MRKTILRALAFFIPAAFAVGCSSTPRVTSADLARFTNDLATISSAVDAVPTDTIRSALATRDPVTADKISHAIEDVKAGLRSGVKASDLMTRVAQGAGQ